jgi:hypothetical protein
MIQSIEHRNAEEEVPCRRREKPHRGFGVNHT